MEPPAPEAREPEKPVEVVSEQPAEAVTVNPTAPKAKKRKLKSKSSAKPVG